MRSTACGDERVTFYRGLPLRSPRRVAKWTADDDDDEVPMPMVMEMNLLLSLNGKNYYFI